MNAWPAVGRQAAAVEFMVNRSLIRGWGMTSDTGVIRGEDGKERCFWGDGSAEYRAYHDEEWGRPVVDDFRLYEKICLEGFQSGLSWLTILRKRENFRKGFAGFD